jgi:hypothetical protein
MMRARFFAHPVTRIVIGIAVVMAATFITLAVVDSLVPRAGIICTMACSQSRFRDMPRAAGFK